MATSDSESTTVTVDEVYEGHPGSRWDYSSSTFKPGLNKKWDFVPGCPRLCVWYFSSFFTILPKVAAGFHPL